MTPVKSASIAAAGHDPATQTLTVQFKSGETYHYAGVSADQHSKLMAADSVGSHFQSNIRQKFKGKRQA
jgi:hypothetical protein